VVTLLPFPEKALANLFLRGRREHALGTPQPSRRRDRRARGWHAPALGAAHGQGGAGGAVGIVGLIVYLLISQLGGGGTSFGVDSGFPSDAPSAPDVRAIPAAQDPERTLRDFSAYVFAEAQDTWAETFARSNRRYERAQLVLYRDAVSTGCGDASSAVGPFVSPGPT
jgi:predicted metalloprotease